LSKKFYGFPTTDLPPLRERAKLIIKVQPFGTEMSLPSFPDTNIPPLTLNTFFCILSTLPPQVLNPQNTFWFIDDPLPDKTASPLWAI